MSGIFSGTVFPSRSHVMFTPLVIGAIVIVSAFALFFLFCLVCAFIRSGQISRMEERELIANARALDQELARKQK